MMTDVFSSLDCNTIGKLSILLWICPLLVSTFLFTSMIWKTNPLNQLLGIISYNSNSQTKTYPMNHFLFGLMFFLLSLNLIGMIPFVYGPTSNLWLAGSLAILMWGLLIFSGWAHNPTQSAAHLAPAGAPAGLMPLLILIETVSTLIRPLTLTVRLIANISAGHIVLSLMANVLVSSTGVNLILMLSLNIGYSMFEIFVCVIQAYIFSLLAKLYAEEHPM